MVAERQPFATPERSHVARYALASKRIGKGAKVLDVFCGSGYGAKVLADRGHKVTAFDSCNTFPIVEGVTFLESSYPASDFQDGWFDAVTAFEAIEHVHRGMGLNLLHSIRKWLRQGGTLWLSTPNADIIPFDAKRFPFHRLHYTPKELERMLVSAGFSQVKWLNQARKGSTMFRPGPVGAYMVAECK